MHYAIVTPPVPGHLHPFGALGRELIARGHRVTVFHMPDVEERARAEVLDFVEIGASDHPPGSLARSLEELGRRSGLSALRYTVGAISATTEMICRDAPAAFERAGIDRVLVDQTEPAGAVVASMLGLPYFTVCNALMLHREPDIPPPFTPWLYRRGLLARLRNLLGYRANDLLLSPVAGVLNKYRRRAGLAPYRSAAESYSTLAQISQQPEAFDFPRRELPPHFHYCGPLRRQARHSIPFPWDRLDGRPLIYASLGTLQKGKARVFHAFAEACRELDVQLVITHGGNIDAAAAHFPGTPIVVSYAPQRELLSRAALTLTHAGLNTVLDSLSFGVPLVAVPITFEQPAIAARIRWTGAGEIIPQGRLTPALARRVIRQVLENPSYREKALTIARSISASGGVERAASLVNGTLVEVARAE